MFEEIDIQKQLLKQKLKSEQLGEHLLTEANRILKEDLFTDKKILQNIKAYNKANEVLDENVLDKKLVFTLAEIKQICITYRLKYLDSQHYQHEIPYPAIAKIKNLNEQFQKELKYFKILSDRASFTKETGRECLLMAKTNNDNYYIIHRWGNKLKWNRKLNYWPLQTFENLCFSVALITLILTLSLPSALITLDNKVGYFSGFRIAAFFHLLIFNFGVTVYFTFTFNKNFSSSVWDQANDFD